MTEMFICESCGWGGNKTHPVTGGKLGAEYNGEILCSSCRVDKRLADNDYKQ